MAKILSSTFRLAVLGITLASLSAADPVADPVGKELLAAVQATGITTGLVVQVGATEPLSGGSLAGSGRMVVELLSRLDAATVARWREQLDKAGCTGLVSVVPVESFAALPYPDRLANVVVADLDALGTTAPADQELHRVVAPYGALCVRKAGQWIIERIGLDPRLDEWAYADHGPDGNPLSHDQLVARPQGIQWHLAQDGQPASHLRIGSGVAVRSIRSFDRKRARPPLLTGRDAANGLRRWTTEETPTLPAQRGEFFEASWCISDGRMYGLLGKTDRGQALDLHTGEILMTYDQGLRASPSIANELRDEYRSLYKTQHGPYTIGLHHLVSHGLLVQGGNGPDLRGQVIALDPVTGQRQWLWDAPAGQRVVFLVASQDTVVAALSSHPYYIGVHYRNRIAKLSSVVAIDLKDGRPLWTSDLVKDFMTVHIAMASGGVFINNHVVKFPHVIGLPVRMLRFDLRTGQVDYDQTKDLPKDSNWANKFVIKDGKVICGGTVQTVLDAITGQPIEPITVKFGSFSPAGDVGHCSTWRAVSQGWLTGKFSRFVPWDGKVADWPSISRTQCDEGSYPAYGMVYAGDGMCECCSFLRGAIAMHCQKTASTFLPDEQRLEHGPAWGTTLGSPTGSDQWPAFLANAQRSSWVDSRLGTRLEKSFSVPVNPSQLPSGPIAEDWALSSAPGIVSAPVVADGLALVAATHVRRLVAVDAATGQPRWSVPLAARLETPPTIYRGMVLFGCNDGTVSCLRATDGAVVWRFLAAPAIRRIVGSGQVESVWPVPASVVVHHDRIFAAAGRHNQADGGLFVWRLTVATGEITGKTVIDGRWSNLDPGVTFHDSQSRANDILSVDRAGIAVHLRDVAINPETLEWMNLAYYGAKVKRGPQLAPQGLNAERTELFARPYELNTTLSVFGKERYGGAGPMARSVYVSHKGIDGKVMAIGTDRLVCASRTFISVPLDAAGYPSTLNLGQLPQSQPIAGVIQALAITEDRMIAASTDTKDGKVISFLTMYDREGNQLAVINLPAPVIPKGIAIAGARIYLTCADGSLNAFTTP